MAAPTPTARGTPTGIKLRDGYVSLLTCSLLPTASFFEKTNTPPKMGGVTMIDQTTMWNLDVETAWPGGLWKTGDGKVVAAYDPNLANQILSMIRIPQVITQTWADGSTIAWYGVLIDAEFGTNERNKQPEVTLTFGSTNMDTTYTEQRPVITSVSGS